MYDRIVQHVATNRHAKRPACAYRLLSADTSCSTRTGAVHRRATDAFVSPPWRFISFSWRFAISRHFT